MIFEDLSEKKPACVKEMLLVHLMLIVPFYSQKILLIFSGVIKRD